MLRRFLLAPALVAALFTFDMRPAQACGGGMFYPDNQQETVSVAGHAVVVSISQTRTVLWDRISYAGAPESFAWVMPVAPGAELEVASAEWLNTMIGATGPVISSPSLDCGDTSSSSGCSGGCMGEAAGGGDLRDGSAQHETVTVVSTGFIGPYETATIKSDVPGAIGDWLTSHGYAIPDAVKPTLDDYAAKGLEFIAARLAPGKGIQDMQPVRVIMPGSLFTFPMRMLAAGAKSSVPITLVVIAEGRYQAQGFSNVTVDPASLTWDYDAEKSNYTEQRAKLLAQNGGKTWLTSMAIDHGLVSAHDDVSTVPVTFSTSETMSASTLGALYLRLAASAAPTPPVGCTAEDAFTDANNAHQVVELCADQTQPCSKLQAGEFDASRLACGDIDDLAVAMVGMHPHDLRITRLEADLPVATLVQDLTLGAVAGDLVEPRLTAAAFVNPPCEDATISTLSAPKKISHRGHLSAAALALGITLAVARKRARRRR